MDHRFQINLRGLIDLLSNHLYSGPEVFVRELLQNAVDAVREQLNADPEHPAEITLELHTPRGKPPLLLVNDNGVGLTEEDVHQFLATIGESSKRLGRGGRPQDYLGQFGIGILSCFVVSEEIVVLTRAARGGPSLEWRAKPDGLYTLRRLETELPPGTQVCLTAKADAAEAFEPDRLRELAEHYGVLLPFPIRFVHGKANRVINEQGAPWRQEFVNEKERNQELLAYGQKAFGMKFSDAIPLRSKVGDVDGVAFVLPYSTPAGRSQSHRVYLKNMLLTEEGKNLLPDWAFFVRAIVNANDLRPTASRESFYEDRKLKAARQALGQCLRGWLVATAERRPELFERLLQNHALPIKALALEDEECFRLFIDWLPFETTRGERTFGQIRADDAVIRYASTVDGYREVARVAAAQGLSVVNAGYVHDTALLAKAAQVLDDVAIQAVEPSDLAQEFQDPPEELALLAPSFLAVADKTLRPLRCQTDLKSFQPKELPALYSMDRDGRFIRHVEQSKENANQLWSGILDNLSGAARAAAAPAQLVFNANSPLIAGLLRAEKGPTLQRAIELLYVQALLLGHHPLSQEELKLSSTAVARLVEAALRVQAGGQS